MKIDSNGQRAAGRNFLFRLLHQPPTRLAFHYLLTILSLFFYAFDTCGQTGSVVTVNSDRILVLNGRKVFPIGFSPGPPTFSLTLSGKDAMQEFHDAGALLVRMTQTVNWDSQLIADQQAALDWAGQHGMFCWVNLRELSKFSATDTNTPAMLKTVVDTFRNHPALGLWKNFDEAWWGGVSVADLKRGYDVIRQEDTNHPIVQTHAPRGTVQDLQPYNVAADVLALDIYPIGYPPGANSLLSNKELSMIGDWTSFLGQVANSQKQYWMVEQIAWSGVTPPGKTLRFPTFFEERYMAYEAIINGARGLMFFGGNIAATLNPQDAALGWNWTFWDQVLKRVVQELGDGSPLAPALVTTNSSLPITISGTTSPDVEFCVREVPPYIYILASKREGTAIQITFSGLPAAANTGELLYESPRTVTAVNGQFTDWFAPFEVHAYRFLLTNQAPVITTPPQSRTNNAGTTATFNVVASGLGTLSYQWRRSGTNLLNGGKITGATSSSLVLSTVSQADAGGYNVVVTGIGSVTSAPPATLTVVNFQTNQNPNVTSQPQSQTNTAGTTASFGVGVSGNGPFGYQWRKNGTNLFDGGNVLGSTSSNLSLFSVSQLDAAAYDVLVIGYTSVTSSPATLVVITAPPTPLILYEPFDYTGIGLPVSSNNPVNWAYGGSPPNDLNVAPGSLSYSGLAAPVGNSVTNGGAGLGVRRLFGTNINDGVLYFSALFRINNLGYGTWNGAATPAGSFTATDSTTIRLGVQVKSNSPSGYVLGVQKSGTGATTTFGPTEYHAGDTVFLVGKYDFTVSPNPVTLWINPPASTLGLASEPVGGLLATTGTDGFTIDRFNIRQNTAASVPAAMQWDELRIGGTWASVTPVPVVTAPGFSLSVNPSSHLVSVGGSTSYSVIVTGEPGFSNNVNLTVTGLPAGTVGNLSPSSVLGSGSSTLNISVSASAPVGNYALLITGLSPQKTNSTSITLSAAPALLGWGDNLYGQSDTPVALSNNIVAISAGGYHNLALAYDGHVVAWGNNSSLQCAVPSDVTNALAIAAGGYHSLALRANGTISAWGDNSYGQTVVPNAATGVVALAAGGWHSLALRANGTIVGWGDNGSGQTTIPSAATNVITIAAGGHHSLALRADGTVLAWGSDLGPYGNFGGQVDIPPGLNQVSAIAAGGFHSMALRSNGLIAVWGDNTSGQSIVPATVTNASAIAAGNLHSLALLAGGAVEGWGNNLQGECVFDSAMRGITAISAGTYHSLTLVGPNPPGPSLLNASRAGSSLTISLPTSRAKTYFLQYKTSLTDSNWQWASALPGNGSFQIFTESTTDGARKYYRVQQR